MQSRTRMVATAAIVLILGSVGVRAQTDPAGGQHRTKVMEALTGIGNGSCLERLMGAIVLDQCEQQLTRMREAMRRLGPIRELRYRGTDTMPTGIEVEVYRITFENGQMTWMAATGPNGKLSVLWSPG